MNLLECDLSKRRMTAAQQRAVMDEAQDIGLVSDNCVTAADVCDLDALKVIKLLFLKDKHNQPTNNEH